MCWSDLAWWLGKENRIMVKEVYAKLVGVHRRDNWDWGW